MNEFYERNIIIKQIKELGFTVKKSLGQNFLMSEDVCDKIVDTASRNGNDAVVEVGPGLGILTDKLCKKFKKVLSIELDKKLFQFLCDSFSESKNISLINGDALGLDINKLLDNHFPGCKNIVFCSNLPYYITSPLIMKFLESERFSFITVMVQKEAAERILASPGTRQCGAISTAVRYYSEPEFNFHVSKENFFPVPKVDSSVISFKSIKHSDILDKKIFFNVLKSSFKERRKNILNSISSGICVNKSHLNDILTKCRLDKNLRAENLKFDDFVKISNLIS